MSLDDDRDVVVRLREPDDAQPYLEAAAFVGDRVIGTVSARLEDRGAVCVVAWGLVVDVPQRRRGIGSKLMESIEEWAVGHGAIRRGLHER